MILLIALLACADDKAAPQDTGAPEDAIFQPLEGSWEVTVGQVWEGDCALDDPETHQDPAQTWWIDPRGDTMNILPDPWGLIYCTLEEASFSCDMGSWSYESGNAAASITHLLVGTFTDERTLAGAYTIDAACEGNRGCGSITGLYGADMEMPCSVSAEVSGTAAD